MHRHTHVEHALKLYAKGLNQSEIGRILGINRRTICDWVNGQQPKFSEYESNICGLSCSPGPQILASETFPQAHYVYLLGLYLGDGSISTSHKGVHRLRIVCCDSYPNLIKLCEESMFAVMKNKVGHISKIGCTEVYSDSKHWTCLFPQHGPGRKHERKIELADWQQKLIDRDPRPLLEGLIHSDGCRVLNWVNGKAYPRYHFSNVSLDICKIFSNACEALGVEWKRNNFCNLSVARRKSVALLDSFIGPKS